MSNSVILHRVQPSGRRSAPTEISASQVQRLREVAKQLQMTRLSLSKSLNSSEDVVMVRRAVQAAHDFMASGHFDEARADITVLSQHATPEEIALELSKMTAAFPGSANADLGPYSAVLLNDIIDKHPTQYAIATTSHCLRTESDGRRAIWAMPSGPQVMEEISKHQIAIAQARSNMETLSEILRGIEQRLAEREEADKARAAQDAIDHTQIEATRDRRMREMRALSSSLSAGNSQG